VPQVVARVGRELDDAGLHFLLELLASGKVDLLYGARKNMIVASAKRDGNGLLGLLKQGYETFECVRANGYRAANAGQLMVDPVVAPQGVYAAELPGLQTTR